MPIEVKFVELFLFCIEPIHHQANSWMLMPDVFAIRAQALLLAICATILLQM